MVSNAFADQIERNNGKIQLNSEVASIIINGGRAVGVQTAGGNKYFAKNIISNASAEADSLQSLGQ